jgi:hypothetical protein
VGHTIACAAIMNICEEIVKVWVKNDEYEEDAFHVEAPRRDRTVDDRSCYNHFSTTFALHQLLKYRYEDSLSGNMPRAGRWAGCGRQRRRSSGETSIRSEFPLSLIQNPDMDRSPVSRILV